MVNFVPLIPKFIMQKSIRLVSGLYLKLSLLTVAVGLVLRVVLLFNEQTTSLAFSFGEWCEVFLLGAVNDFCAATAGFIFLWLFMLSVSRTKYRKPWGYILLALLVAAFCYVAFFNTIFDEYGSVAPRIALYVLGYWAGSFALRLFLPGFRSHWTTVWFALFIVVYVGATSSTAQRIFLLERIRRPLQLHRRRLPGLHQRGGWATSWSLTRSFRDAWGTSS